LKGTFAKNAKESTDSDRDEIASHSDQSLSRSEENVEVAISLAISKSVIRALSFLGPKKVVESVLDILELEHAVSVNDIARKPEAFISGIQAMFGPGSYVIIKVVCAEIAKDLGVSREGKTLSDLVKIAREKYTPVTHAS
jgi:hypothetical protein